MGSKQLYKGREHDRGEGGDWRAGGGGGGSGSWGKIRRLLVCRMLSMVAKDILIHWSVARNGRREGERKREGATCLRRMIRTQSKAQGATQKMPQSVSMHTIESLCEYTTFGIIC